MTIYILIESKESLYDDRIRRRNLEAFVCRITANSVLQKLEASKEASNSWHTSYYIESLYLNQHND